MGGYFVAAGLAGLAARIFAALLPPGEAVVLSAMLAFIVYLALLIWGFVERYLGRLWLAFGGAAVAAFWLPDFAQALGVH